MLSTKPLHKWTISSRPPRQPVSQAMPEGVAPIARYEPHDQSTRGKYSPTLWPVGGYPKPNSKSEEQAKNRSADEVDTEANPPVNRWFVGHDSPSRFASVA